MDLNSLTGKDLDKYGESVGIARYQGLGLPEDDDSYRESIRHNVKGAISFKKASDHDVCVSIDVEKRVYHTGYDPMYGVLVIDTKDGTVIRIAAEYNGNAMAIYNSFSLANRAASEWTKNDKSTKHAFVARELKLFEG